MGKVYVSVNHGSSLIKELHQQFKEGKNCDLEIRLNEKRLYVHKCLIDIFFMKVGAEIEDDRFYLDLTQYSQEVVESLVGFVYTGNLCCPLDKITNVYVAAAEVGCIDAQKGCQIYLQSTGALPVSTYHGKRMNEQATSESNSETESLDASQEPPKVKIEVVDDSYEYQSTDSSNFAESLESVPKIHDYASTVSVPPLSVSGHTTFPSASVNHSLNYSSSQEKIPAITSDHPKTIAVPVGMHSTPEDFKLVEKRSGRTTIIDETVEVATSSSFPTKRKAENKKSVSIETEESKSKRGRKCRSQGTTVEYVYPKQPVISPRKWQKKRLVSLLNRKSFDHQVTKKAGKHVIDGLRSMLQPGNDEMHVSKTDRDANKAMGVSKTSSEVKEPIKDVEKQGNNVVDVHSDMTKVNASSSSSSTGYDSNRIDEVKVKTEIVDAAEETHHDQDLESEKNEQMLFLGLTKTIDEDKRRLEEESAPKTHTHRLRVRKKVDYLYSKTDTAELDELEATSGNNVRKRPKTASTAVGESVDSDNSKGKRAYAATVAVKKCYVNSTYFPPAGTVPDGTRSCYAKGSYMRTKFVTESIEDKDGNVTVISKRVPVRPRQFGIDERLKNRPAVYICHPTAPVINPNTRAPKLSQTRFMPNSLSQ